MQEQHVVYRPGMPDQLLRELVQGQCVFIDVTTPATAGQELAIRHGLGRVPRGYCIIRGDRAADLPQDLRVSASPAFVGLTLSGMGVAGFVKNSASGVLSGGNSLAASDLPAHDHTASNKGGDYPWADIAGFGASGAATTVARSDHDHSGVYQPLDATLTAVAGASTAADKIIYFTAADTANVATLSRFGRSLIDDIDDGQARATLGLIIGSHVQAHSAALAAIALLSVADSNIIVGNGTTWVAESGETARTSLGLGTGDSPQFTGLTLSGDLTVNGDDIFLSCGDSAPGGLYSGTSPRLTAKFLHNSTPNYNQLDIGTAFDAAPNAGGDPTYTSKGSQYIDHYIFSVGHRGWRFLYADKNAVDSGFTPTEVAALTKAGAFQCDSSLNVGGDATIGGCIVHKVVDGSSGDTTPSVAGADILVLPSSSGAYSISTLDGGTAGQIVTIYNNSGKTVTYTNGATLRPVGGANYAAANQTVTTWVLIGTVWRMMANQT